MSGPFGFRVEWCEAEYEDETSGWNVNLPHQCDAWDIAGRYAYPLLQAEAIAELERFIAEAQEALSALREGKAYGGADDA